jgi:hypothetical protein
VSVVLGPDGTVGATRIGTDSALLALLQQRPAWWADALCQEYPEVSWFPKREGSHDEAVAVRRRCLVRQESLDYAMGDMNLHGVWGGTTRPQRKALAALRKSA